MHTATDPLAARSSVGSQTAGELQQVSKDQEEAQLRHSRTPWGWPTRQVDQEQRGAAARGHREGLHLSRHQLQPDRDQPATEPALDNMSERPWHWVTNCCGWIKSHAEPGLIQNWSVLGIQQN